jgi:RND family efflux transporter MFP subunit
MFLRILLRLLLTLVVLAAAAYAVVVQMRPVALVTPVVRHTAVNAVPATITVQAETRELRSDLGGRIARSTLELGRAVTAGEVLVELDTAALAIEIARVRAELASNEERKRIGPLAATDLVNAREQLAFMEEQERRGSVSRADVNRQRRAVEQLENRIALETVDLDQRLNALASDLKLKEDQLSRMSVRAPIDGVVSRIFAREGDLIGGGATVAEIIADIRTVEARISEEYIGGIAVGQVATVRLLGLGNETFEARVARLLPASDPQTQRYVAHLEVAIDRSRLVPGITGEALIIVAQRPDAMVIPRSALLGRRVFVVEEGRIAARMVEPGFVSLREVEILEGLRDGELVVVDSLDLFRPGQRVRTEPRPPSLGGG